MCFLLYKNVLNFALPAKIKIRLSKIICSKLCLEAFPVRLLIEPGCQNIEPFDFVNRILKVFLILRFFKPLPAGASKDADSGISENNCPNSFSAARDVKFT